MTDTNAELANLDRMRAEGQIDAITYDARRAALMGGTQQQPPSGQQGYPSQPPQGYPPQGVQPGYGAPPPYGQGYPGQQGYAYGQQPYPGQPGGSASIMGVPKAIFFALVAIVIAGLGYLAYTLINKPAAAAATQAGIASRNANPLIGTWVSSGSRQCQGATLAFTDTSLTESGPGDLHPEILPATYNVISPLSVAVTARGKAKTITVVANQLSLEGCTFTRQAGGAAHVPADQTAPAVQTGSAGPSAPSAQPADAPVPAAQAANPLVGAWKAYDFSCPTRVVFTDTTMAVETHAPVRYEVVSPTQIRLFNGASTAMQSYSLTSGNISLHLEKCSYLKE